MTFKILCCDGGGIRGYISSRLIQDLDKNYGVIGKADGFAGTSTGGLIAIALASGVSIHRIVGIYEKDSAAKIFTKNHYLTEQDENEGELAQGVMTQEALTRAGYGISFYTSEGLKKIMTNHLGTKTFADISEKKMLAVNSAQLDNTTMKVPSWAPATLNNKKVGSDYSTISLVDAALATSAAPAYFPPHKIGTLGYFADGGTYANDPVLNGIVVALNSGLAGSLQDIQVLSMGTGITGEAIPINTIGNPLHWGALRWLGIIGRGVPLMALLNLSLSLSAQNSGDSMGLLLKDNMVRIDPVLSKPVLLDGYTKHDYKIMDDAIDEAKNSDEWKKAVNMVKRW